MTNEGQRRAEKGTGRLSRRLQVVILSLSLQTSATYGAELSKVGPGEPSAARSAETGPAAECTPGALIRGAHECASANKILNVDSPDSTPAATTTVREETAPRIARNINKMEDDDLEKCPSDLGAEHPDIAQCLEKCADAKPKCIDAANKLQIKYDQCKEEAEHQYDLCDSDNNRTKQKGKKACKTLLVKDLFACETIIKAAGVARISCGAAAAACAFACVGGSTIKACWAIFK